MDDQTQTITETAPVTLPGATRFDMTSKISGRTYRIFVYQPLSPPPEGGYPVVVTTDANLTFPLAATMASGFALRGGPAPMIVGVGYAADEPLTPMFMRNRDLTPPTPAEAIPPIPGLPPPDPQNYGGDEDFYRFLVEELRPAIAAAHPVNPDDQTLFGHSLGGLFVLGMLFRHPTAFKNFVASSPSIWWNGRAILAEEAAFSAQVQAGEIAPRVLVMIGAKEQDDPTKPPVPSMTLEQAVAMIRDARMVDNACELGGRLTALKGADGYAARFHNLADEDHMSVTATAVTRALWFAMED
jgi:predicted alpha/beta superfamily hydrolase